MDRHITNKITIAGLALLLFSCQALKHNNPSPFKVKDAIYYSWFVNEYERGTNVELTLTKLNGTFQFEAIIFRNMKIPLATIISENSVLLKGVLPGPESILPDLSELTTGPNRLLFIRNGDSSSVNIDSVRRVEMKYFKPE
jgi:hypothetical protein